MAAMTGTKQSIVNAEYRERTEGAMRTRYTITPNYPCQKMFSPCQQQSRAMATAPCSPGQSRLLLAARLE
ncbi:hypothetical protein FIBSPDRAFT_548699 [Athelia psychrophila]|uniref:Uncharacterized protein n=1 Tax=Athelia psychrophila TaxID=1759441 RepID=A0A166UQY6_9AGAM|nr:hypothetical protein FIBSPDRAFT_548699 [Fibularhizoctonia sp. CBS 109695]